VDRLCRMNRTDAIPAGRLMAKADELLAMVGSCDAETAKILFAVGPGAGMTKDQRENHEAMLFLIRCGLIETERVP
jgi:hypothetical protein